MIENQTMKYHVSKPCEKAWEELESVCSSSNKFCNTCSKTIYDFTSSSDEEIGKVISIHSGEQVCGIIHEREEKIWENLKIKYKSIPKFILIGLFCIAFVSNGCKSKKPVKRSNPGYMELKQ